ncbi:MAG: quinone-dependent dihydroorotate dehydrogenase [Patescibacteria group bacterium]|nr:quinone-dependent dihydroorotate dehydrogenase [Patescibacteria group bacterium]
MILPKLQNKLYKIVLKPILFKLDPEFIHDLFIKIGVLLGSWSLMRWKIKMLYQFRDSSLEQNILGIHFTNPVGLAAGFDKNAQLTKILPDVGFGFQEIGSITGRTCHGNAKPRLWRIPKSRGLIVYYGLKNKGCKALAKQLQDKTFNYPVGVSIAKTNDQRTVTEEQGIKDYAHAFKTMKDVGDFFVINTSCPNAFGGEPFSDPLKLEKLLERLDKIETNKPIFLKIAVDTTNNELDQLIEVAKKHRVHGFVVANLTKNYQSTLVQQEEVPKTAKGGVSGKPMQQLSDDLIAHLYQTVGNKFVIVGVGGIFSAEDAYRKIKNGANLVELITGMIYEGPQLIGEINQGLTKLLQKDGYKNIAEAVGANFRK